MKRILCLILVLVMCLIAVSGIGNTVRKDVSQEADIPISENTDTAEENKEEEPPVDPKTIWNGTLEHGGEGFYDPERDYSSEERFKVCVYSGYASLFEEQYDAAFSAWFALANVQYDGIIYAKHVDTLSEIEQIAKEYDGVVIMGNFYSENADIARILKENNCSFISFGDFRDYSEDGGGLLCPTMSYTFPIAALVGGVAEYIDRELRDIPPEKVGIIYGTDSYGLPNYAQQFLDEVTLQMPEYINSCYMIDHYTGMLDYLHHESFFEKVLDENPNVEYWIHVPYYNAYYNKYRDSAAVFARRGLDGKAVTISMNNTYDVWVTDKCKYFESVYSYDVVFRLEPAVFGLCSLMRGEVTPETLWADHVAEGEAFGVYPIEAYHVVTRYNYKDYFAKVNEYLGAEVFVMDKETLAEPVDTPPEAPDYRYEFWAAENYPEYATFRYDEVADKETYAVVPTSMSRAPTRYDSVYSLSEISPVIVHGEIIDVRYIDNNNSQFLNLAYTVYDIKITECIHGDYRAGDIISVFEYGGYIRSETYNGPYNQIYDFGEIPFKKLLSSEIIEIKPFADTPRLETGDECVMFLSENKNIYHYGHSWKNTGAFTGRFVVDENGTVSRWSEDGEWEEWGTLDELLDIARGTDFSESAVITRDLYCP